MAQFEYECNQALNTLQANLKSYKNELYALQSLKRVYKKDGTDFQSFIKNFETPSDVYFWYADYARCKEMNLNHNGDSVRISRDSINKEFIKKIEETEPARVLHRPWLVDSVELTPAEFMDEVKKLIEYREESIKRTEETIKNFERITAELKEKIDGLTWYLEDLEDYYTFKKIASKTVEHFYKN